MDLLKPLRMVWAKFSAPKDEPAPAVQQPVNPLLDGELGDFRQYVDKNILTSEGAKAVSLFFESELQTIKEHKERIFQEGRGHATMEEFVEATRKFAPWEEDLAQRKEYIDEKFGLNKAPTAPKPPGPPHLPG